jgi:hypothetical protein
MKSHSIQLKSLPCLIIAAAMLLNGCVHHVDLIEVAGAAADRRKGPLPESQWNRPGLWQRVADTPPTYIPVGYPRSAPRTEKEGTWVVDKRDSKRLFVPNTEVNGIGAGVLMGEAIKVTNWPVREMSQTRPGILAL